MRPHPPTQTGTAPTTRPGVVEGVARPLARFGLHFLEMCAVMCVGGIALSFLFFEGAVLLGFSDLPSTAPVLSVAVIATNLTAPMVAWMRYRHMEWRPTLEMAATTVVTGVALIVGYLTGLVEKSSLIDIQTSLACPLMLAVMVPRFHLYSSAHHHAERVPEAT
jgi:hypothetical protein